MQRIRIGVVGVGKIARDQHIPALRASPDFLLVACAGRVAEHGELASFATAEQMIHERPDLQAVAICTPPQARYDAARTALHHRKHVLLEKPPCATVAQLDQLTELARETGCTLFQTWHAREAAAVEPAVRWLRSRRVLRGQVVWKENVRYWHPGQTWIWQAGGFGVLDAGINAISILTKLVAEPVFVTTAELQIPANCESPIAAAVTFTTESGAVIDAEFDFRYEGEQCCELELETEDGRLSLTEHGNKLVVDGDTLVLSKVDIEYSSLYSRFADLIRRRESDVDSKPFQLVADILIVGSRIRTEPFEV